MVRVIEAAFRALKSGLLPCGGWGAVWIILAFACYPSVEVQAAAQQAYRQPMPLQAATGGRWYRSSQVVLGHAVFRSHCARCHGARAQGLVAGWKQRLPDGSWPPPPLDGRGHAWHHALPLLLQVIQQGGSLYEGRMPGFAGKLSEEEQLAAIAWFQSLWSDEVYHLWTTDRTTGDIPFSAVSASPADAPLPDKSHHGRMSRQTPDNIKDK